MSIFHSYMFQVIFQQFQINIGNSYKYKIILSSVIQYDRMQQSQEVIQQRKIVQKPVKFLTDSKKGFEYVFKLTYLTASIFSAILLRRIYQFQTMPEFEDVRKGTVYDILFYSIPFGTLFTIFDLLIHYVLDDVCQKYYLTQKKYQGKARNKRAYTLVKWAYSVFYYLISSIAAIYIIKDTDYFPSWLGGNGSCHYQFVGSPNLPNASQQMKIFYLFQFGKHFSRLISHMFIRQQGNYYEYVLHHALSTFLILFSYLTNQWLVGIMVLFCHDVSDLFLIFARAYKDYKHYSKKVLQICYFLAIVSWVGGRLIIFPVCCVYVSVFDVSNAIGNFTDIQKQVLAFPFRWMGYMLIGLQALQLFWTYYIGKAFVQVSVSSKIASNTYE